LSGPSFEGKIAQFRNLPLFYFLSSVNEWEWLCGRSQQWRSLPQYLF
jgi:hypothetical protein